MPKYSLPRMRSARKIALKTVTINGAAPACDRVDPAQIALLICKGEEKFVGRVQHARRQKPKPDLA